MERDSAALVSEIRLLHEEEGVVFIYKPAGLLVHPDGRSKELTVCDWVLEHYPQAREVGEPLLLSNGQKIERPGIVHRLDRETSGVLSIATTPEAFGHLKKQFQAHKVEKSYRAFVHGRVESAFGTIDKALGRSKKDFRQYTAPAQARGELRSALTHFALLRAGDRYSYLEVSPKTGRTHQIRVHLKSIKHPVVCDRVYARELPCAIGFGRLALHAHILKVYLPSGKAVSVEAPLPQDFLAAEKLI